MKISFEKRSNELILCYTSSIDLGNLQQRLSVGNRIQIKHTFFVDSSMVREAPDDDFEDTLCFCIGTVGKVYTQIDSEVIGTDHHLFFSNDIALKQEMFVAYRNISILRKVDRLIERDFYVGGDWETVGGMPFDAFREMIQSFPKTAELDKYARSRIASRIKEYFPETDKYEAIFERYIMGKKHPPIMSKANLEIELAQFSSALEELKQMINYCEGIHETVWQDKVQNILRLLYPKYILCTREIQFAGVDGYDKRPDFILVDTNGFVDILEIKKPEMQLLTEQASYRNNYVPVREFSGVIQQVEKYILCLTSIEKSRNQVVAKLSAMLPSKIKLDIVSPQAMIVAGRNRHFNLQQKRDFELIRRQYKHIADIITYDDLVARFENVITSLKGRIG